MVDVWLWLLGTSDPSAGTLVPWYWLQFPLSALWSQPVGLTWLLERTDEVKDLCLGHNGGGRCRKTI